MWSNRKQTEDLTAKIAVPETPDRPLPEEPVESGGRIGIARPASVAIIGKGMIIKGEIRSAEHMHISGEIDGSLYLAGYDITITAESKVRADVTAREVDISGSIQGNVDATRKITVRKGGKLIGNLRTPGIVIEDGAYFKGNIEIVNREPRREGETAPPAVARANAAHA